MATKISVIVLFKLLGNVAVPAYAFVFWLSQPSLKALIFFVIVSFFILERAWETFKTSKETKINQMHGDWTLVAVTATYLALFFIFISEFHLAAIKIDTRVTFVGVFLWFIALGMRFWGMKSLGDQWAIHAVGAKKIRKITLIKKGPYKYIRHPIYTGIMIEVVSFPIMANATYALIFSLLVCVPLIAIRAFVEEKSSLRRFGKDYNQYQTETGMILPKFKLK